MIVAVYFSPTGSTKTVVQHVAARLSERLATCFRLQPYTLPSDREAWQPFEPDDIALWASPVYAGRVPNKTLDFVRQHLHGKGNKGIAISVFGNRNYDNALAEMCQIMTEGGIIPTAAAAIVARHAFAPDTIAQGRPTEQDYAEIDTWIDAIELSGTVSVPGSTENGYYQPLKADSTPANFLKAKPQVNEYRCMVCGKCKRACPMGSIEITYKGPEFHGICIKCQSCIRRCPEQALTITDEDFLSHVEMLKNSYSRPAQNHFFLSKEDK